MKKALLVVLAITMFGATIAMADDAGFGPGPKPQPTGWYFWSYLPNYHVNGELYPDLESCAGAMWTYANLVHPVPINVVHTDKQKVYNLQFMTCMPESRHSKADAPNIEGHATRFNAHGNLEFSE